MPLKITLLCCAQALLLDAAPNKSLLLTAQAAAPLFDRTVTRSRLPPAVLAMQALLLASSLLLGAAAVQTEPQHGGMAMNALVKSLAPLLSAWMRGHHNTRHWLTALGSFLGIALATGALDAPTSWQAAAAAYIYLLTATVCGVALGLAQERYGQCPLEMAIGSTLICAATLALTPLPQLLSWQALLGVPLYGLLSLYVSRAVRDYSSSVQNNAFLLSLMLNERRAATIALSALVLGHGSDAPLRLFGGAGLALASLQLV